MPMTPAEAWERRTYMASRQGGLGEMRRRHLAELQRTNREPQNMPPPARLPRRHLQGSAASTHEPPAATVGNANVPRHSSYKPAGYRSESPDSVSSLSEGGFSELDRQLSDELADIDEGTDTYVLPDLHVPVSSRVCRLRLPGASGESSDSDLEGVDPNVVFPGTRSRHGPLVRDQGEWRYDTPLMDAARCDTAHAAGVTAADDARDARSAENAVIGANCPATVGGISEHAVGGASRYATIGGASRHASGGVRKHADATVTTPLHGTRTATATSTHLPTTPEQRDVCSQAIAEMKETGVDARPSTPPPVTYDATTQLRWRAETRNRRIQTTPETRTTGAWTGEVPRPWLSTPDINLRQLARHQVLLGEEEPLADIQQLSDRVVRASGVGGNAPQRRVVSLMTNYAAEVLHAASELIINGASARIGQANPMPHDRMWHYCIEQLAVWNNRRGLPQEPVPIEDEDIFDWLH